MYTHIYKHVNCKSGERMEQDNDQRNSVEKKMSKRKVEQGSGLK